MLKVEIHSAKNASNTLKLNLQKMHPKYKNMQHPKIKILLFLNMYLNISLMLKGETHNAKICITLNKTNKIHPKIIFLITLSNIYPNIPKIEHIQDANKTKKFL